MDKAAAFDRTSDLGAGLGVTRRAFTTRSLEMTFWLGSLREPLHTLRARPQSVLDREQVAERVGYPNHETIENIQNLQGMAEQPPFLGKVIINII